MNGMMLMRMSATRMDYIHVSHSKVNVLLILGAYVQGLH